MKPSINEILGVSELTEAPNPDAPTKPMIEFFKPSELKAYNPPEGLSLVGDFHIQKGEPYVIGGAPGIGKSRSVVALAVAGATGADWFGLKVHRRFKTMIIQAENGRMRLKNEFSELNCAELDAYVRVCPPPPFGLAFDHPAFIETLKRELDMFQPDNVVVDPWNQIARDDKARDYALAFDALTSVLPSGEARAALGIVGHTRKPRSEERANGRALLHLLAGSYVLGSVPRSVFIMQAASDEPADNRVIWTCCKNNDGSSMGERSIWERRNGLFAPVTDFDWTSFDGDGEKRRTVALEDLDTLFEGGKNHFARQRAVEELIELTGLKKSSCYTALKPDGKFAAHLVEQSGLLSFKP